MGIFPADIFKMDIQIVFRGEEFNSSSTKLNKLSPTFLYSAFYSVLKGQ